MDFVVVKAVMNYSNSSLLNKVHFVNVNGIANILNTQ